MTLCIFLKLLNSIKRAQDLDRVLALLAERQGKSSNACYSYETLSSKISLLEEYIITKST